MHLVRHSSRKNVQPRYAIRGQSHISYRIISYQITPTAGLCHAQLPSYPTTTTADRGKGVDHNSC